SGDRSVQAFRAGLYQAVDAIKTTLRGLQVEFDEVEIFGRPPDEFDVEKNGHAELHALDEARAKVRERLSSGSVGFVVDVLAFPIKVRGQQKSKGCVVIVNPSAWVER